MPNFCGRTRREFLWQMGAGFTGLWTAYYLARADPTLRIVVLEREVAGFGASGRNGGWCSALFPASVAWLAMNPVEREDYRRYGGLEAEIASAGIVLRAISRRSRSPICSKDFSIMFVSSGMRFPNSCCRGL